MERRIQKMSHQTLKSFIDLVTFDQRFIEIQNKITKMMVEIAAVAQKQKIEEQRFETISAKQRDMQKSIHDQEFVMEELQLNEERLLKNLDIISAPKEYDAATKELERVRLDRNVQEQRLLQLFNRIEFINKEQSSAAQQHQDVMVAIQETLQEHQKALDLLHQEMKEVETQRGDKLVGIPSDWLETYELMRGRVGNPVVPLQQDSCSACFYGVTPRDLQSIRNKYLIQCKDCYRFLYEESAA